MDLLRRGDLNILEVPVAPFIQKDPPRFQWANKFNKVQADEILRDTETKTQYYDDAVLAVARDQNQRRYGIRSWYGPKIKNFRPPLLDPEFDLVPLSRIPRPRTQARTNPVFPYRTQNEHDPDVGSYMNPRRINGAVINNIQVRFENPQDYEIVPDLEFSRPQACGPSGYNGPIQLRIDVNEHPYLQKKQPDVEAYSSKHAPIHVQTTPIDSDSINLQYSRAQTNAEAYTTTPIHKAMDMPYDGQIQLEYNRAQAGGKNAETMPYSNFTPIDSDNIELYRTTPIHDAYTNPSIGVDTIDYAPQEVNTIERVRAGYHNAQISPVNNPDLQRNDRVELKPRIQPGGYHTIASVPTSFGDQNVHLKGGSMKGTISSYGFN